MFTTNVQRTNADALAGDFAVIARLEASLTRSDARQGSTARGKPDFSRLQRFIPDLKI